VPLREKTEPIQTRTGMLPLSDGLRERCYKR
jgi:hypothetical protein